jgi:membrane protein DedA with SNARE-associated domain
MIWLIIGGIFCAILGYGVGRSSGREHILNRLTQQHRRELEQKLRNPQNRNRSKKR